MTKKTKQVLHCLMTVCEELIFGMDALHVYFSENAIKAPIQTVMGANHLVIPQKQSWIEGLENRVGNSQTQTFVSLC